MQEGDEMNKMLEGRLKYILMSKENLLKLVFPFYYSLLNINN